MPSIGDLLQGIVVETKTKSFSGAFLYSDKIHYDEHNIVTIEHQPWLNELAKIPVIGIAAGVTRMALALIHTVGHLLAAVVTFDKGHLIHAAKGGCEFLRGFIEAIPIAGRYFANNYYRDGEWWIIKIYNPDAPDSLDRYAGNWQHFKQERPSGYSVA